MLLQLTILAAAALLGAAAAPSPETLRLQFTPEVHNLEIVSRPLRADPPKDVLVCPSLAGEKRYGAIPFRALGGKATQKGSSLIFAAAWGESGPPKMLIDLDHDGELGCGETLPLLTDARRPGRAFRTVSLARPGQVRPQRYRISVPLRLEGSAGRDGYTAELVDVPVARWTSPEGKSTLWILFDGNVNGVYDRQFGDALLVDTSGERKLSADPSGESFLSYHLPMALPWGTYELAELDPQGSFAVLRRLPEGAAAKLAALGVGDRVEALPCNDLSGRPATFGGATGRYQLVFFWLSLCGSCAQDAEAIAPVLAALGPERLTPVGVSLDEDPEGARRFVEEHRLAGSQCFAGTTLWDNAAARRLGVSSPSTFLLLDPEGRIRFRGTGFQRLRPVLEEIFPELRGTPRGTARQR
ncbi:MAG TPA: TlpA disulfide reductase family protein [Thermoanaerobaculia bacterium]|nr:TlpA disulfide reductase family protein [Thermoanaerobaculia bacterium]